MKKTYFRTLITGYLMLFSIALFAQGNQCPNCSPDMACTVTPAYPALCPVQLPDGQVGVPYDQTISFYMPAQFVDPGSGITVTLLEIEVLSIANMPYGLNWTSNIYPATTYYPSSNPPTTEHGCARICGTPLLTYNDSIQVNVRVYVDAGIGGKVTKYKTFNIRIKINPSTSGTSSFTVTNPKGCSPVTAGFQANYASNGNPNFAYAWDFGNGLQSTAENPPNQTYSTPGNYKVILKTTIDTLPYYLSKVDVLASPCWDTFSAPDFFFILEQGGTTIINTDVSPGPVNNTNPPVTIPFAKVKLNNKVYGLEVWDDDSPLGPDSCGKITFYGNTAGTFTHQDGSLIVQYTISHNILTFSDTSTITVYPNPVPSPITISPNDSVCATDSIRLFAGINSSYQWYKDTAAIVGGNDSVYYAKQSGSYSVKISNSYGCTAISQPVKLTVIGMPPKPTLSINFSNGSINTNLNGYNYQWYEAGTAISGASQMGYTPPKSGWYLLKASNSFGCTTASDSIYFSCPSVPVIIYTPNDSACAGQMIKLTTNNSTTYQWILGSANISGATSSQYLVDSTGTYSVVVSNGMGCKVKSNPVKLTVIPMPPKPLVYPITSGLITTLSGFNLQWYKGTVAMPGATQMTYNPTSSGYYHVVAFDYFCTASSDSIYFNFIGIKEVTEAVENLVLYPNPTNGRVNVTFDVQSPSQLTIAIRDILGRTLVNETHHANTSKQFTKDYDLSINGSGIYFLVIQNEGRLITKKIIVN